MQPGATTLAKRKTEPLAVSTRLYVDFEIAKSLGVSYTEYKKLPKRERRTWYLWHVLSNEKERYQMDQARKEAEHNRPKSHSRPSAYRD